MIKKTLYIATSVALLLLTACSGKMKNRPVARQLAGTWQIADIDDEAVKSGNAKVDLEISSLIVKSLQDGLSYSFFTDGQYSKVSGGTFTAGKWSLSPDATQVLLKSDGGKTSSIDVVDFNEQKMTVQVDKVPIKLTFSLLKSLEDETINPLHPTHNKWRTKAIAHESDEQLLARLKNLTQHYIYLLEASQAREDQVISFAHSPSLIKIYSGGIGTLPEEQLKDSWKNIFFDAENEVRAYELFENILQKGGDLNIKSAGSWVKDDILILKAIYANF
jgi:hypothetical protein